MAAELVELRLPAFKSLRNATVPLGSLNLLVGRNGSGKSNILDALAVLSAIAGGSSIRDALDGGRDGPVVRGGSEGCAPIGEDRFAVGCTAQIDGRAYHLDVTVSIRPSVQVLEERLWTTRVRGANKGEPQDLLASDAAQPDSGDLVARWDNGKRGRNPPVTFRAAQLLTSQVAARVPATSVAGREVHRIAEAMLGALGSVFILDPVPHQMREYVPAMDLRLRRTADNLSAVLAKLLTDADTRATLLAMTSALSEAQVSELDRVSSDLGDVMVTIKEKLGSEVQQMPARLMSDGTLRFLAIAAALLDRPQLENGTAGDAPDVPRRLLVVEELENGLHPSQAALLLDRLKRASAETGVRTLATTHSPAILDALSGDDHHNVIVCSRDDDGWSRVTVLTDFPDYFEVAASGALGGAAVRDRLRPGSAQQPSGRSLVDVLGL